MDKSSQSSNPPVGRASSRADGGAWPPISSGSPGVSPHHQIEALTRAMARGDEAAFREFYTAYFDRLLRYLLVVTGGHEETAREALQLTLVRVARHVKAFDAEEKFWSWLTVLARSALADESRKRRRYFAFLEKFTRHNEIENETKTEFEKDGAADEQLRALLNGQMKSLPDDERRLLEQKYLLRQSVREIADAQQTTEKAVESKLSRVRQKLKSAVLMELKNESPN